MQSLVRKLQSALAAVEAFPVADTHEVPLPRSRAMGYGSMFAAPRSTGDGSSLSNGLAAISQPFKLRLQVGLAAAVPALLLSGACTAGCEGIMCRPGMSCTTFKPHKCPMVFQHAQSDAHQCRLCLLVGLKHVPAKRMSRVQAAPHEKQLLDYSSNTVLIDTMASLAAVEEFLHAKVWRSVAAAERARTSADAAVAAARPRVGRDVDGLQCCIP